MAPKDTERVSPFIPHDPPKTESVPYPPSHSELADDIEADPYVEALDDDPDFEPVDD